MVEKLLAGEICDFIRLVNILPVKKRHFPRNRFPSNLGRIFRTV